MSRNHVVDFCLFTDSFPQVAVGLKFPSASKGSVITVGCVIAVEGSCEQHLDGDYVRRGEFGDTGVAPGNPAKQVNLLRVGQAVGDGIGNDL